MIEQELRQRAQRYRALAAQHHASHNPIAVDYERIADTLETWASGMAQHSHLDLAGRVDRAVAQSASPPVPPHGVEAAPEPLKIIPDAVLPPEPEAVQQAPSRRRKRVADDSQGDEA